jgi:hypothetical protein
MYSSTKQVKDYVFCADCEQCFGKVETWIKPMLLEVGGPFLLRERLMKQAPIDKTADWELYETVSNPEINVDKLTHFGIGVFYKGAVHPWKNGTPEPYLEVAPEEQESLRKYLLGLADLPKGMALSLSVDSLPVVWQGMIQPYRAEPLGGFKRYVFYVPGIFFHLLIGEGVQGVVPNFSPDPRHLILDDWKVWGARTVPTGISRDEPDCVSMPGSDIADRFSAIWKFHVSGRKVEARHLFTACLPLLRYELQPALGVSTK